MHWSPGLGTKLVQATFPGGAAQVNGGLSGGALGKPHLRDFIYLVLSLCLDIHSTQQYSGLSRS